MARKYYYCPNCGNIQKSSAGNECSKCSWLSNEFIINKVSSSYRYLAISIGCISILIGVLLMSIWGRTEHDSGTWSYGPLYPFESILSLAIGLVAIAIFGVLESNTEQESINEVKRLGVAAYGQPQNKGVRKSTTEYIITGVILSTFGIVILFLPIPFGLIIGLICIISGMSASAYGYSQTQQSQQVQQIIVQYPPNQQQPQTSNYEASTIQQPVSRTISVDERLSKLADLRAKRLITDEEYLAKKSEILKEL
jgi:hypothetical protein